MKIRNGDTVVVITGKDKGKTGQVLRVLTSTNRVVVAGINMRTKHIKKTPTNAGQRLQYEASLDASNVMLVDPKTGKRSRVGFQVDKNGNKKRVAKKSGEAIAKTAVKAPKKSAASGAKAADEKRAEMKAQREGSKKEKPQTSRSAPVQGKTPFWKKMGFGEEAMEEGAEMHSESHMHEDHSVPEQEQSQSGRSHQRGK